jgi:hypothetical protein
MSSKHKDAYNNLSHMMRYHERRSSVQAAAMRSLVSALPSADLSNASTRSGYRNSFPATYCLQMHALTL